MTVIDFGSDLQPTFNKVCAHLAQQGEPSLQRDSDGSIQGCKYRDSAWRSCAVGCLIPDELYRPELDEAEGSDTSFSYWWNKGVFVCSDSMATMLSKAQTAHDAAYDVYDLRGALLDIADFFSLDASAVNTITEWNA